MKQAQKIFKSLAELSPENLQPEPDGPAPALPKHTLVDPQQPPHFPLPVSNPERSYPTGYRQWGINE